MRDFMPSSYYSRKPKASPSSPSSSSSSSIPFAWEQQPGVPKHREHLRAQHQPLLPPPPPHSSISKHARKNRSKEAAPDPFAVALAECTKQPGTGTRETAEFSKRSDTTKAAFGRWGAVGSLFGIIDLYGSCKDSCSVADSTVFIPRASIRSGIYAVLNRQAT